MRITKTLPPSRIGLATLALTVPLAGADAAARSATLNVSLTILSQCIVRTSPLLQPADVERLVLAGQTTGTVLVQCSRSTPYSLAWSRDPLRSVRPDIRLAPLGTAPFNSRFVDWLAPDSPLSLTDSPSRLIMPSAPPETTSNTMATEEPSAPPMMVITF